MPDLIVAAYEPLVATLAGSVSIDTNILAYLRAVGRARSQTIALRLGMSLRVIEKHVAAFVEAEAVNESAGCVSLTPACRDILPNVIAIEVKVDNWRRALSQALRNRIFAHRSFIALPDSVALRVLRTPELRHSGIGVVSIDAAGGATIVKPATARQPNVWGYYYKLAALVGERGLRS